MERDLFPFFDPDICGISIHALRMERDALLFVKAGIDINISIHALRMERDMGWPSISLAR